MVRMDLFNPSQRSAWCERQLCGMSLLPNTDEWNLLDLAQTRIPKHVWLIPCELACKLCLSGEEEGCHYREGTLEGETGKDTHSNM